jgi:hypothetical protein
VAKRRLVSVQFQLRASSLDFYVDVRLRQFDGRWLAVAQIGDEPEIGLGTTARDALAAALSPLGPAATNELLADPALWAVSRTVAGEDEDAVT